MKLKLAAVLSALFLLAGTCGAISVEKIPDPEPVFKSPGNAHQNPVLKVGTFVYREKSSHEQPVFEVGNKSVAVRRINGQNTPDQDQVVTIYIDSRQVGSFRQPRCGTPRSGRLSRQAGTGRNPARNERRCNDLEAVDREGLSLTSKALPYRSWPIAIRPAARCTMRS